MHEKYLEWGEAIYTGVVDSVKSFPGYNRVAFTWEINADPRITKTVIYWDDRADSTVIDVNRTQSGKLQLKHTLDLPEGGYLFEFVTKDNDGHQSRYIETNVSIYGSSYADNIALRSSRTVTTIEAIDEETADIHLDKVEDNTFRYTELTYVSYEKEMKGVEKKVKIENETDVITLDKIRLEDYIKVQSFYFPSENALDGIPAKEIEYQIPLIVPPVPEE